MENNQIFSIVKKEFETVKNQSNNSRKQNLNGKNLKNNDHYPMLGETFQKFNPSTSPPNNLFMERLFARNLVYQAK